MKTPLISIIVPCYNVEQYLPQCIESVINQTYQNWELILVDDGSSDNSGKICDEYAAKDNRIIVIHQENAGVSAARNRALEIARGEWITFIDSDDWFEKNAFDIFNNAIKEHDCERYIFNRYTINNGVCLPISHLQPSKLIRKGKDLKWFKLDMLFPYYDQITNNVITGGIRGVNCSLYKAKVIKDNNIRFDTNIKIGEDAIFNFDVITHSKTVMLSDIIVGNYRVNSNSVMHSYTADILNINEFTINGFYSRVANKLTDKDYKRAFLGMIAECIFRSMKLYLLHPNNKKNIRERIIELKGWINNPIVENSLKDVELDYLPVGKKQIMWSIKNNQYLLGGILGKLAILYLKKKKEI